MIDFTDILLNQHFREQEEREAAEELGMSLAEYREHKRDLHWDRDIDAIDAADINLG